jgi:hypothetical protein
MTLPKLDETLLKVIALVGQPRGLTVEPASEVEACGMEEPEVTLRRKLRRKADGLEDPNAP